METPTNHTLSKQSTFIQEFIKIHVFSDEHYVKKHKSVCHALDNLRAKPLMVSRFGEAIARRPPSSHDNAKSNFYIKSLPKHKREISERVLLL